jgi:hypothetical protein
MIKKILAMVIMLCGLTILGMDMWKFLPILWEFIKNNFYDLFSITVSVVLICGGVILYFWDTIMEKNEFIS